MKKNMLKLLFLTLLLQLSQLAIAAEETTYILLNISSDGPLSARRLVFTERRSDEEFVVQDIQNLGRGRTNYILRPIKPGNYYLSSIFPWINQREVGRRVKVDDKDGVITIKKNTINYIGDVLLESKETNLNVAEITDFTYQPNSATLMAAAKGENSLFKELDVVVSIAGNKPVPVRKELLGLEN